MKTITINEFINLPQKDYLENIESVKYQLEKIYKNRKEATCWSPYGLIGVEVDGVLHRNKTTYDILLETKVKIKDLQK